MGYPYRKAPISPPPPPPPSLTHVSYCSYLDYKTLSGSRMIALYEGGSG